MNQHIPRLLGLLSASLPSSDLLRLPLQEAVVGGRPVKMQPSPALTSIPESAGRACEPATNKAGRFNKARQGLAAHLGHARERLRLPRGLSLLQPDGF